ncbi:MAG: thioredoxin family protein [Magnetospiraceae bacterium]
MATQSDICDFGWQAVDFSLKGVDGGQHSLQSARGENGLLVAFICNHCPYVKRVIARLVADAKVLQENGIGVIAIMPNDTENHPADSFENMQVFAQESGFTFPYVIDETQATARAYEAVCTPDFFGFNKDLHLQYRGRLDSAGATEPTGGETRELLEAMLAIGKTGKGPQKQVASMGCSVKWREE